MLSSTTAPARSMSAPPHDRSWLTRRPGLIIAASVLVAAGIAVYEHPQVQEWFEKTRRKIAVAIHNIGEGPRPAGPAGPTEEEIVAAVEAARRKRDEILARNRDLFVRPSTRRTSSETLREKDVSTAQPGCANFDDFLQGDGTGSYTLHNTSSERADTTDRSLRHRTNNGGVESRAGLEMTEKPSSRAASQIFLDATSIGDEDRARAGETSSDTEQDTAAAASHLDDTQPLIEFDSEADGSLASSIVLATPASSDAGQSWTGDESLHDAPGSPWVAEAIAERTPPHLAENMHRYNEELARAAALAFPEDGDEHDHDEENPYPDVISESSGMHTPATWTEVGSDVSEGDYGVAEEHV